MEGFAKLEPADENKKGDSLGHPRTIPLVGTKKGKAPPIALEAALPVIFSTFNRVGYLLQR